MRTDRLVRRLTGAAKNAVVWGAAWGALAFVTMFVMRTLGIVVPAHITALDMLGMAIKFGVVGGITGGAFALFISLAYRGRRLADISPLRFGLGGGLLAGLFVPTLLLTMNFVTGGGALPFSAIGDDMLFSALFGGVAAGGSMWLAQRAAMRADDDSHEPAQLGEGDARMPADAPARERNRERAR